jgi:hypothetical protein
LTGIVRIGEVHGWAKNFSKSQTQTLFSRHYNPEIKYRGSAEDWLMATRCDGAALRQLQALLSPSPWNGRFTGGTVMLASDGGPTGQQSGRCSGFCHDPAGGRFPLELGSPLD